MIRFLRTRIAGERGAALPMVIGITVVLGLLVTTAVTYATGGFRQSAATEEWSASLAAAYAGVEDYQSRLSEDTSYVQYGNPASKFTLSTGSSVKLPAAAQKNDAFNVAVDAAWQAVPGGVGDSYFRYEVDNSNYAGTGNVRIQSTGKVGGETRSIVADLRQDGFIDFLYFTDYEMQDPAYTGKSDSCVKHWWAGRDKFGVSCGEIAFDGGDTIKGPAHSNDTIRICEATFLGELTTAYAPENPSDIRYTAQKSNGQACGDQNFGDYAGPSFKEYIGMPATNSEHLRETRADLTSDGVPRPGCLYTGPTEIVLMANGKISVTSPWTKATRTLGSPASAASPNTECGTPAQLASGTPFALPANNVIYVQNVPTVSSDPNYWAWNKTPSGLKCEGAAGGTGNGIGYPVKFESAASGAYGCRVGDLFVEGTLNGQTTLSAEHYVYVIGDITYNDPEADLLGLVGNDAVWVWNPVKYVSSWWGGSYQPIVSDKSRRIDAAILSVSHTFLVQNPAYAPSNAVLTVNGAIAQKFRGIVSSNGGGYAKDYVYDERLKFTAPPKFLSPVTTTYGVNVWIEVKPAYSADGTPTP
ncbi:hypothetical protein ESZ53_07280 [Salinibacterium sp. UTAS2018]|uniref:hypothetical protein n=1 Tax=Salinibacterium sp. UTAS2018 TaxID=2508880 RepID=UPI0010097DBF|nr:hypothetical protein [Salinibacterium sp. UTAS2018]QAV70260.1 hypothetical protein ESZ53_07280 [Salinibacterium sp. UTAS2018]